jgi:hypothetical protein
MKTSNAMTTAHESRAFTENEQQLIGKLARPGLLGRLFPRSVFGTRALQADLAGARVDVWTVVVDTCAVLDPPADFGFVVFIDLGNSMLMGLAGGDWIADSSISSYPDEITEVFTTPGQFVRGFRLERLPASGMVLRFEVLDPSTVAARYRVAKKDLDYFGQSIVFPGRLESLREDLNRHLASMRMTA